MGRKICLILFIALLCSLGVTTALADETDQDLDYPWRGHAAPFDHLFGNMIDGHQQTQLVDGEKLNGFIYVEYTGETTTDGLPVARKVNCASGTRTVGWVVKGIPTSAKLINKSPRIWLVDPADLPKEKGYTHFHWTGGPQKPHGLEVGQEYPGYLMKRIAPTSFFWLGGGGSSGGHSGGCGGETGGCGGEEGGCTDHDDGGCTHEEGDSTHVEGSCTGDDGGCTGDDGGCSDDHDGGCTGDDGGCGDDHDGGCSGGGGSGGSGHGGRIVPEGVDPHSNIVTDPDATWSGCGGH